MSLNICAHCTTRFSIGAPHCPQCGNADYYQEGSMAKISRHGGPTYAGEAGPEFVDLPAGPFVAEAVAAEEAEPVSPYDGMLRADLQAELDRRGLPTSGNKAELVARLVAADELSVDGEEESGAEPEE